MFKASGATHEFDAEIPPPQIEIIDPPHESVAETLATLSDAAGKDEYNWAVRHPEEARKILTGDHMYFFPGVVAGDDICGMQWVTPPPHFIDCFVRRNGKFTKGDRIVTRGN